MHNSILDFSEEPAHLCVRNANLVVKRPEKPEVCVPLADVAVVVASHPQVSCTQALLGGLCAAGGAFVACDDTRMPVGMMLPIQGHFSQTDRIGRQIAAKLPMRKRLWQQIIQVKIRAQAAALQLETGDSAGLYELARRVRSGDPSNVEAQAARRYWLCLFEDDHFVRDREAGDVNRLLNYGYAVLRAVTGRAICAVGLHPSVGLHHHNRYSSFVLADDLMEPFRPVVDRAANRIRKTWGHDAPLDKVVKAQLIESITGRYVFEGENRALFDIVARVASSLVSVFSREEAKLALPAFPAFFPDSRQSTKDDEGENAPVPAP